MAAPLSLDEIWGGDLSTERQPDLFNRRKEAEQLIAYIESIMGRASLREDKRAYTIAINARYGEGKSFFLRRLAEHLSLNHPVALVDAWADDLSDDPLTALAATLRNALEPFANKSEVRRGIAQFMSKTGQVAKIIGIGLVRRGAGLVISGKAVEAAEEVLANLPISTRDVVADSIKETGQGVADDAMQTVKSNDTEDLMAKRLASFEEGKSAVKQMKDSLSEIITALNGQTHRPPIVIVIDELDRCRPTYAIKLLEEIKHLFDVPGIVFILAVHSEQLAHSVSGAYGSGFDGRAYLRRFIDREYRLARPDLGPLLALLWENAGLSNESFGRAQMVVSQRHELTPTLPELLAEYMKVYDLGARDAFHVIDILQTSAAIAGANIIHMAYFLPLAFGLIKGLPAGLLPEPVHNSSWAYLPNWSRMSSDVSEMSFAELASSIQNAASLSPTDMELALKDAPNEYALRIVSQNRSWNSDDQPIWTIGEYPRLLETVSRFTNPQIETTV